ncbi:cell wall-binding repeat-containing protein [Peptoclostridium sp. AF21-18]|uniref:cell wall-binding repeat-containing protein n=1 Tax=Peptoclostridium sp. AF21-18 TaxID=2292243 RepID=UPI000E4E6DF7|nr:cell wall-binding repeat-containing protein [Peptoclostridium sp. AF21-18]RHQ97499.1 cell wall-binding repeat-containing protein [Peptoclostridium sp. AF21-18]
MNKERLSVVMAGAMLASSVAPVLAAETTTQKDYEVNGSNKGLLIRDLRELILTKGTFENVDVNGDLAGHSVHYAKFVTTTKTVEEVGSHYSKIEEAINAELKYLGETAVFNASSTNGHVGKEHTVKVGNSEVTFFVTSDAKKPGTFSIKSKYDNKNFDKLETLIQNATTGSKVEVWDNGHIEKDGKFYGKTLEETKVAGKFTATDLTTEYNNFVNAVDKNTYPAVYKMELKDNVLTVYTRYASGQTEDTRQKKEYTVGSDYVDFTKAIAMDGNLAKPDFTDENGKKWITAEVKEFAMKDDKATTIPKDTDITDKHLHTVTITDVDNVHNVVLSDLYDGLFLTEKGEELLDTLKAYDAEGYPKCIVREGNVKTEANGLYSLTIELEKTINKETVKNQVVITTNNKARLDFFADGIAADDYTHHGSKAIRKFPVQKLVGATRHETAVKVAKENADIRTVAENGNIVLVNSDSLVDGLAAAPLAASAINLRGSANGTTSTITNKDYVAPILLTNRDGLDKATKDYIKEIVAHQRVGNLDKVTVYLVGGEAVISKAVENDLKEAGLRVIRAGGKDREETSLKVANLIEKDTRVDIKNAFVVGANGEADAMSIASYAADNNTPIIVESVHGISEATVEFLKGYKKENAKDVTIVGGEKVVSKETEELLKSELKDKDVDRLAGANRKATNAKVIDLLYTPGSLNHILVSKDGIAREGELIDALTATSIAAKYHTPIVLGTNNLSKEQIEAIEDKTNRRADKYVYQIGGNVAESVMRTIAERLNLAK